jgi:hypothetical protein
MEFGHAVRRLAERGVIAGFELNLTHWFVSWPCESDTGYARTYGFR